MRVRQPVVHGHQADFRTVSEHEKYEGERQYVRLQMRADLVERGPEQGAAAVAQYALGGQGVALLDPNLFAEEIRNELAGKDPA